MLVFRISHTRRVIREESTPPLKRIKISLELVMSRARDWERRERRRGLRWRGGGPTGNGDVYRLARGVISKLPRVRVIRMGVCGGMGQMDGELKTVSSSL